MFATFAYGKATESDERNGTEPATPDENALLHKLDPNIGPDVWTVPPLLARPYPTTKSPYNCCNPYWPKEAPFVFCMLYFFDDALSKIR